MVNLLTPNAKTKNDENYTPPELFEKMGITFDLDVCAPKGGVPWIPAARHYSIEDDGLSQPWTGRVWMNPPFSKPLPWIKRFIQHGNGIALVPTSTGQWMSLLWSESRANWLMLTKLNFYKPNGEKYKGLMPTRLFLVAIGDENTQALTNIGLTR